MDLATIKMHIDNFVDTWEGWGKIFSGLAAWQGSSAALTSFGNIAEVSSDAFTALSSNK